MSSRIFINDFHKCQTGRGGGWWVNSKFFCLFSFYYFYPLDDKYSPGKRFLKNPVLPLKQLNLVLYFRQKMNNPKYKTHNKSQFSPSKDGLLLVAGRFFSEELPLFKNRPVLLNTKGA